MTEQQLPSMDSYVRGTFVRELFYNEENSYGVFLLDVIEASCEGSPKTVTVVGNFLRPHEEEVYTCYGEWRTHARFGEQFFIERLEKEFPRSKEAVVKYLSSDLFHGIGKKTAIRIVKCLGEDALKRIFTNPKELDQVEGLNETQKTTIIKGLGENRILEQALVFLYESGFGAIMALKIVQMYKHETLEMIKENPYRLIDDIEGIGFRRADELARKQGIAEDAPQRLRAAILYLLQEASYSNGHVYLTKEEVWEQVKELLGSKTEEWFPLEVRNECYADLLGNKRVLLEEERVYLPTLFYAEYGLALKMKQLLEQVQEKEFAVQDMYQALGEVEEAFDIHYADCQREAIMQALRSSIMILTGGPGTGKTTVIRGICHLFGKLHECSLDPEAYKGTDKPYPIRLVAPTGRAAKRMSEATGLPAMTIHRLLGWKGEFFEHHAENPIEGSLLIVDETSMLDIWLANQLFRSLPSGMQVILVGDRDQLPSVGPGKVLHHLLEVERISRVELDEIFRQAGDSSIIQLAHQVRKGDTPEDLMEKKPDRRFFPCNRDQAVQVVLQTYENAIQKGYTLFDVQILCPIYKGPAGVDRMNQEIQQLINPKSSLKKEVSWGDTLFRMGDKVLQTSNHPEFPVYNGDMGIVTGVEEEASSDEPVLYVSYEKLEVPYKRSQLGQLTLGYACSIHKSQGSEFAIVILPVLHTYRRMLARNLIYTGITRAKSYLILCGEKAAFSYGITQEHSEDRNSRLSEIISEDW
ncbi:ATP-dependent RecD-like DNA helicase [Thermoactinomyces sp. DSM 45892]|uniref:SF1B family DNA helicase RecD2 n=1 Tax=Thermoactinomyces sp. DSM 45892 TaxID=1882753 RepID=UPI00089883E1|nr:ATP-dependent RecD-like DNA helicase [Thermoactinomyces sp. DSM 45892]SDY30750.1 exodeoxyribonuclease V alpha subunit [Thermoactinomyces sp. DSM 45892]